MRKIRIALRLAVNNPRHTMFVAAFVGYAVLAAAIACGGDVVGDGPPAQPKDPVELTCHEQPRSCYPWSDHDLDFTRCSIDSTNLTNAEAACALELCLYDEGFEQRKLDANICLTAACGIPYNATCNQRMHDMASDCYRSACSTNADLVKCREFRYADRRCD